MGKTAQRIAELERLVVELMRKLAEREAEIVRLKARVELPADAPPGSFGPFVDRGGESARLVHERLECVS